MSYNFLPQGHGLCNYDNSCMKVRNIEVSQYNQQKDMNSKSG